MGKIWLTSDLHLCHNRNFLYGPRGFDTVQEANETIIKNINEAVAADDVLYILGDLMLNDNEVGMELLRQINCRDIRLIRGNHDSDARWALYDTLPNVERLGWADMIHYKHYHFYLSHHKTQTSNLDEGAPLKARIINIHGHTHSSRKFETDNPLQYNVALDAHDNKPVCLDQIIEDIKNEVKICLEML